MLDSVETSFIGRRRVTDDGDARAIARPADVSTQILFDARRVSDDRGADRARDDGEKIARLIYFGLREDQTTEPWKDWGRYSRVDERWVDDERRPVER